MEKLINIGVAKIGIGYNPEVLRTILGSCVGICLYDKEKRIGGLAHVLLPAVTDPEMPEKFAESAVPLLFERILREGGRKELMTAIIAGGSHMLHFRSDISLSDIGKRNIESSKKALAELGIPIVGEDTGGNHGRVIDFFMKDGHVKVKKSGKELILNNC